MVIYLQIVSVFPVAQMVKNCLQCRRPRSDPCVGKIPWRRVWQSTSVFLPGKFHGQRSLVDHNPWGPKEPDTTEWPTLSREVMLWFSSNYSVLWSSCSVVFNSLQPHGLFPSISWSLLKLKSIELMMLSNHLVLCRPLLLLPSIHPPIWVFSNELALYIGWPNHWSFSISPYNKYFIYIITLYIKKLCIDIITIHVYTYVCVCVYIYISWRQWQATPVLLPGKSHGPRSLVGCSPWGH